jgi:hypothetical protein
LVALYEGLTNVTVYDLAVQLKAKHLVVGTHGRSIYLADKSLLQGLSDDNMNKLVLGDIEPIKASRRWGTTGFNQFGSYFDPSVLLHVYSPTNSEATVQIISKDGIELNSWKIEVSKGINIIEYNVSVSENGKDNMEKKDNENQKADNGTYYLPKGVYEIFISVEGRSSQTKFDVK